MWRENVKPENILQSLTKTSHLFGWCIIFNYLKQLPKSTWPLSGSPLCFGGKVVHFSSSTEVRLHHRPSGCVFVEGCCAGGFEQDSCQPAISCFGEFLTYQIFLYRLYQAHAQWEAESCDKSTNSMHCSSPSNCDCANWQTALEKCRVDTKPKWQTGSYLPLSRSPELKNE